MITSLTSCWRGGCMPEGTCDCAVMLPRVFPEGTSGEGGTQLAGRHPDRDAALLHEVTCSQRQADHVTARRDVFAARSEEGLSNGSRCGEARILLKKC